MKLTIKDEHHPITQSFTIIAHTPNGPMIQARGVSPELAAWIVEAAETLEEILDHKGMQIHGTPLLMNEDNVVKEAFRLGSSKAFDSMAALACVPWGNRHEEREADVEIRYEAREVGQVVLSEK